MHDTKVNGTENTETSKPKYSIGQQVKVQGWLRHDFGKILEIRQVYHRRLGEVTWGYRMEYEGDGPGLAFTFVPEGYLSKVGLP